MSPDNTKRPPEWPDGEINVPHTQEELRLREALKANARTAFEAYMQQQRRVGLAQCLCQWQPEGQRCVFCRGVERLFAAILDEVVQQNSRKH